MKISELLKYAYIRSGLNQARLAMKVGVSEPYISYIANRMDPETKHLLPNTSKSLLVQEAINDLIIPELTLFKSNIQKQTA